MRGSSKRLFWLTSRSLTPLTRPRLLELEVTTDLRGLKRNENPFGRVIQCSPWLCPLPRQHSLARRQRRQAWPDFSRLLLLTCLLFMPVLVHAMSECMRRNDNAIISMKVPR